MSNVSIFLDIIIDICVVVAQTSTNHPLTNEQYRKKKEPYIPDMRSARIGTILHHCTEFGCSALLFPGCDALDLAITTRF